MIRRHHIELYHQYNCIFRIWQIIHDDGGAGLQRRDTETLRRPLRRDCRPSNTRIDLQSGSVLYGNIQREGARPPRPQDEQAIFEGPRARRAGTLRRRIVEARGHVLPSECSARLPLVYYDVECVWFLGEFRNRRK